MAGSYGHVASGWSLIENMGDAYECVEELMFIIQSTLTEEQVNDLLQKRYYPMVRGELAPDAVFLRVQELMDK